MSRCSACGKLYRAREGTTLCHACAEAHGEPPRPPDPTDLELQEEEVRARVERILSLFHQSDGAEVPSLVPAGGLCTRCNKHAPIEQSDLCLSCHLELDNVLGHAARELLAKVEFIEPVRPRKRGPSIMDSYGDKTEILGANAVVPPHSRSPRSF